MKNKWNAIARIVGLTCIPAMSLFVLMLINYMIFLKTGVIENIYLQVVIMYGIPIILSLCLLPVKLTKYSLKDIGICRNKRWYQDIILFLGMGILISVFFIKKEMAEMEGAYVIQFLFVLSLISMQISTSKPYKYIFHKKRPYHLPIAYRLCRHYISTALLFCQALSQKISAALTAL